jgi:antitoxin component YwqK of YwqJK toxin-antitoxin module
MFIKKESLYWQKKNHFMRFYFLVVFILCVITSFSQKKEEGYDAQFKPTPYAARYYVITEKKDSLWYREAYYLPEKSLYMEGSYKDEDCKISHGLFRWYHDNKILKEQGSFLYGQKEGEWLKFNNEGELTDSTNFVSGKKTGFGFSWHKNGIISDSTSFDGFGNGVHVSWYDNGTPRQAGHYISDTIKKGRWQYFHPNGKVKAVEVYVNGERINLNCFDSDGNKLPESECEEREVEFAGGVQAWMRFLTKNINAHIPGEKGAPRGQYTIIVQFIVHTNGSVSDITPLTKFGYGMEEEVIRLIKVSPPWIPAQQYGKNVKAYRKQPITFVL